MQWRIKHVFNFLPDRPWARGHVNFGFHGQSGAQYFLHYNEHWLGCLTADDEWLWTAGATNKGLSRVHIPFDIQHPHYIFWGERDGARTVVEVRVQHAGFSQIP